MNIVGENYIYYILAITFSILSGAFVVLGFDKFKNNNSFLKKENRDYLKKNAIMYVIVTALLIAIEIFLTHNITLKYDLKNLDANVLWIRNMILVPLLLVVFLVDIKTRKIPNRLNLIILEIAILSTIVMGFATNTYIKEALLSLTIILIISIAMMLLGKILIGKNPVGVGDLKLIVALSIIVGSVKILEITILSYLLAIIFAIIVVIYRKKKAVDDDYIPFAPFLVISTIIILILENSTILNLISSLS